MVSREHSHSSHFPKKVKFLMNIQCVSKATLTHKCIFTIYFWKAKKSI
jgi:hypothetical protein